MTAVQAAPTTESHISMVWLLIAIALAVAAGVVGSREVVGTWGRTQTPMSCGSVWELPDQDDLNAATCVDDLRQRVTAVGVLVGLSLAAFAFALLQGHPGALAVALVASVIITIGLIVWGRDLILSVHSG